MTARLPLAACAAALGLLFSASAALAVPVYVTQDASVYAEKDLNGTVIGSIAKGTIADGQCNAGWCYVDQASGTDGWVYATNLDNAARHGVTPPAAPPSPPRPPGTNPGPGFSFDFNFGTPQPPRGYPSRPGPRPPRYQPTVCFYEGTNHTGRSFCVHEGDRSRSLPSSWNDRISSITVDDGLTVEVCRDAYLRGICADIDRDVSRLPSQLRRAISSFEVY